MAFFRAIESARSPSKRLFDDSFAVGFLRPSLRVLVYLSEIPIFGGIVPWLIDTKWVAGACPVGVARTKLIDDKLTEAIKQGTKQVVILGAGYDTRAFASKELKGRKFSRLTIRTLPNQNANY